MKRLIGVVVACAVWSLQGSALAQEPFECNAVKLGVTYTVRLEGSSEHRSMTVYDSRGSKASGRATVYRHGTRFFLPGELGAGFKLGIDGSAASLCFENGGNDCHVCTRVAPREQRYREKSSCVTSTPYGRYVVTLYRTDEPSAEMVIEDESGELASGAAEYSFYQEGIAVLRVGPSESYTYYEYANTLCLLDPRECYACDSHSVETGPAPQTSPAVTLARCVYDGIQATLIEQAGDMFMNINDHRQWLGLGSGSGWYEGPATNLGSDRWRYGDYELSLFGSSAELCTPGDGCGPCSYSARDDFDE
jgi:hypothetical protein